MLERRRRRRANIIPTFSRSDNKITISGTATGFQIFEEK